jgi:hypothetical protein
VEFLYQMGSGDSMVRVRDVNNLKLDSTGTKLSCTLTLVASFPRRAVPAPASAPPRKPLPASVVQPKASSIVSTNKTKK